jgi:DNA gyrase inhibitor GyrI
MKKKNFQGKKEKFSDTVDQIYGSWNETSQQQQVDGVLRDRHDELMTQYGPSGMINKGNC